MPFRRWPKPVSPRYPPCHPGENAGDLSALEDPQKCLRNWSDRNVVMKVIQIIVGFVLFIGIFLGSVKIHDRYHEYWLKETIKGVRPGMTDFEVIRILGKPTSRHMSDIPGEYWCYGSDSFNDSEDYCGKVMLEMGPGKHVVSISPAIP